MHHPNLTLLNELFAALNAHDHATMANCYHLDARFEDIAFDLRGRKQIHAMWRAFADTDIHTTVSSVSADETVGQASYIDVYTFTETGRLVRNEIDGRFRFQDGLIVEHHDACDPLKWARQAFRFPKSELVGRLGCLRRYAARNKIKAAFAKYPELV